MFPNHPNLLPAYYDNPKTMINTTAWNYIEINKNTKWVSKPIFGREGQGVFVSSNFSSYSDFAKTTEQNFGVD